MKVIDYLYIVIWRAYLKWGEGNVASYTATLAIALLVTINILSVGWNLSNWGIINWDYSNANFILLAFFSLFFLLVQYVRKLQKFEKMSKEEIAKVYGFKTMATTIAYVGISILLLITSFVFDKKHPIITPEQRTYILR